MAGWRAEGPPKPSISNGFAALASLRRKKKSDKEKGSSQVTARPKDATKEEKSPVYPALARLTVKSWADVGDEDDDDYYATTSPPQAKREESETPDPVEESESEDGLLDEGDDDLDEDHEHDEQEVQEEQPEPIMRKPVQVSTAPKESERQLSKKERRKKDLAEFEAILANFGVSLKEKAEEEPSEEEVPIKEIKDERLNGDSKSKAGESKSAKKKKRKDKARKEVININISDSPDGADETPETKQVKKDTSAPKLEAQLMKPLSTEKKNKSKKERDAAARYCRLVAAFTSSRLRGSSARRVRTDWVKAVEWLLYGKKKSNEEIEAAARAVAVEEAAAKKKEKNHYNQQPTTR